jgi:predicted porin
MNRFLPTALVAALACLGGAAAHAQDAPRIYGLLDVAAGRFHSPGGIAQKRLENGRMSTSFLGISGSDDLGGGLHARFGLEAYLRVDEGAAGRSAADPFWGRAAYVGLQGAFGTSLIGRLPTLLWTSTRLFNPFADSVGFSPSIRQYFGGAVLGDSRWNNSVRYASPEVEDGLSYGAQFNAAENDPFATGKNVGVNFVYTSGPLAVTGVWQRVRNSTAPLPAGFVKQSTYQFGASYEVRGVRLYGQAGQVKTHAATDVETDLYQVGTAIPLGLGFVLASYGHSRSESPGSAIVLRTLSIGYDYFLSKSTDLYAVLMNERATALSSGNTVAAGIRLRF